jgi:predicted MFS family arabinose efflux permease
VALAAVSDLSSDDNRALHLSYVVLVQCIGLIIGPLLGGALSGASWSLPFFVAAALALAAFGWIARVFQETWAPERGAKGFELSRIWRLFVEAYAHRRVRRLGAAFFAMQVGLGLYFTTILVLLKTQWGYGAPLLGLFNGYLGVGFALGLILLLPRLVRRWEIEKIVWLSLALASCALLLELLVSTELLLWVWAFPLAVGIQTAFAGMVTSFSRAVDKRRQGWVMGVAVGVMAIAWAVAGVCAQLIPFVGARLLLFEALLFLAASALWMRRYACQIGGSS